MLLVIRKYVFAQTSLKEGAKLYSKGKTITSVHKSFTVLFLFKCLLGTDLSLNLLSLWGFGLVLSCFVFSSNAPLSEMLIRYKNGSVCLGMARLHSLFE